MDAITAIVPHTRTVTLAGIAYRVGQVRLRDMADLQSILDQAVPDQLEGLAAVMENPDAAAREDEILRRYDAAMHESILYSDVKGAHFFRGSVAGRGLLLFVALRRFQPHLTPDACNKIAEEADPEEFERFYRWFHAANPMQILSRMLLGEGYIGDVQLSWGEAIDELSRERHWSYEQIYDLTITEWINARNHGKPPCVGRELGPGEDPMEAQREWERRFKNRKPGA